MNTEALASLAWIDRSAQKKRLAILGPDRAKFLHNLTTNEVKRLKPGEGREAFVTTLQGKTLALIHFHLLDDRILIRTDPEGFDPLLAHFRKYGVFDDVEILDVTHETFEILLTGQGTNDFVEESFGATADESSQSVREVDGLAILRDDPTGRGGQTLVGPSSKRDEILAKLASVPTLSPERFEAGRILQGVPVFGRDLTVDNLPQELGRDSQTISFIKGCYLGQETVARLDALGHVNKMLKGGIVDLGEPLPPAGAVLWKDGVEVGRVTSSAFAEVRDRGVLLGLVRVAKVQSGDRLQARWPGVEAGLVLLDLPMPDH